MARKSTRSESAKNALGVDSHVVVYPGTDQEMRGVIVEDFEGMTGTAVEIAGNTIAQGARRWAVSLDDGGLIFVDSESLQPA